MRSRDTDVVRRAFADQEGVAHDAAGLVKQRRGCIPTSPQGTLLPTNGSRLKRTALGGPLFSGVMLGSRVRGRVGDSSGGDVITATLAARGLDMALGSEDTCKLGIRVYRAAVERAPEPTR